LLRLKLEEELSARPFQRTCDHRGVAGTEVQDHHSLEVLGLASATSASSHRLISRRHTAVGDFADFQGASDEHT
jgi:hypothetical protein